MGRRESKRKKSATSPVPRAAQGWLPGTIRWLIACFLERGGAWTQAQLAERTGLSVPSLKKKLYELNEAGGALERDGSNPPQVYRSVITMLSDPVLRPIERCLPSTARAVEPTAPLEAY